MDVVTLLADLIALPTVNPMGQPCHSTTPVERPVIEYLERLFARLPVTLERQQCSPIHESLLITLPGTSLSEGTLFEAHVDTVPADDWLDHAFVPRIENGKLYGRGACDDKGSLAAMVLALLKQIESGDPPPSTVWLLAAGDEEYNQSGIRYFMSQPARSIRRAVIGEPTGCIPIIQQKGVIRWDITIFGRSAHTSQPDLGRNAILDMFRVIAALAEHERDLQRRFTSPWMTGPTIAVTMIRGGRTRNAVPDECTIAVDFRPLPEMDRTSAIAELKQRLQTLDIPLAHSEFQCNVPGLQTTATDPLVTRVVQWCAEQLRRPIVPAGVPYGSDACWLPSETPTIVLGPGDIAQAHAIDEFVEIEELESCQAIYQRIISEEL